MKTNTPEQCRKMHGNSAKSGHSFCIDTSTSLNALMAQATDNTSTITRLSGSDNLKRHEALLEEMRKLESDKLLVLDRVYRYEFAQPTDAGKLYAADTTFGKIRACNWEPHEYVYDTKEIGGSTRCWEVGEAVLLAKEKKSVIGVIPVLFLRGSGPKAKHRVAREHHRPSLLASIGD